MIVEVHNITAGSYEKKFDRLYELSDEEAKKKRFPGGMDVQSEAAIDFEGICA